MHLIGLLTLVRRSCELIPRCQIFISQRLSTKIKVYAKPFVSLALPSKRLKGLVRMLLTFDLTFDRCLKCGKATTTLNVFVSTSKVSGVKDRIIFDLTLEKNQLNNNLAMLRLDLKAFTRTHFNYCYVVLHFYSKRDSNKLHSFYSYKNGGGWD